MITKITGEQPFQVLTNNFSISPSNEGYTLQISADGKQYSNLFSVGAGVTRLVTGVAANSFYRLLGNQSEVSVNWMKTCVTEGGSGSGASYTAGDYIDITEDIISVTGITPDLYATSADVQTMINTKAADYTPTSGFSTINGSAITNGSAIVIEAGGDIAPLSAAVETLSAATVGKADAANVASFPSLRLFPKWNSQGIITGYVGDSVSVVETKINGTPFKPLVDGSNYTINPFYAPVSAGSAGDILVSTGGTPVWSAATFAQQSDLNALSAATESAIATIPENPVQSLSIDTIWKGTQAEYDAITTKDPNTFYIIVAE